ncbi:MAG: DUF2892 domain-containing protein [Hyphomicrobiales bacterium]|nr:DUF2892 domain-containing protein [Rickettsiales bacterium]MCP5361073.1 DUF2892 domain-containing protein [Hyphomicrobiales bacterium]
MKKNMGKTDKSIRLVAAVILIALIATGNVTGTLAIILGVVAAVFIATSLISFCPLYPILGISTCGKCCGGGCKKDSDAGNAA